MTLRTSNTQPLENDLVSVVIPVYNAEASLRELSHRIE